MSHVDEATLHAYLDGELPASEQARLEAHLAGCEACRARLEEERALIARASDLLARAAPPDRPAPPLGTVRRRSLLRQVRLPVAWAASVVLALAAGWYAGAGSRMPVGAPLDESRALVATEEPKPTGDAPQPASPVRRRAREEPRQDEVPAARMETDHAAEAPAPTVGLEPRVALKAAEERSAWSPITLDSARAVLGAEPVTVPDLPVSDVRASALEAGAVVVEQPLGPGIAVELHQRRVTTEPLVVSRDAGRAQAAAPRQPPVQERLARYVGSLRIEIAGPLSPDSLSRLLEKARPIRQRAP